MTYTYRTKGTCSRQITVDLDENNIIQNVQFLGGCNGNTQGVARLCVGHPAQEVIDLLPGWTATDGVLPARTSSPKP